MRFSILQALIPLVFSLPASIQAIKNVTVVPLSNDCTAYPKYNSTTKEAGPWLPAADSTGTDIDGLPISAEVFTNNGVDRYGFMTLPKGTSQYSQNITMRCANNALQAKIRLTQSDNTTTWQNLIVSGDPNWESSFGFGEYIYPAVTVQPYAHYVGGQRQPGVFLGAGNSTNWKFKHIWGGVVGEYFLLRLVGEEATALKAKRQGPPLDNSDYIGYLKILG